MARDDKTLRSQVRGYRQRPISRASRTQSSYQAVSGVIEPAIQTSATIEQKKSPTVKQPATPHVASARPSTTAYKHQAKSQPSLHTRVVTTPTKASMHLRSIHKRSMLHIPTLPTPGRGGLLGIFDTCTKYIAKKKKPIFALMLLCVLVVGGLYVFDSVQKRQRAADLIVFNKSVTAAANPDAAEAYIETQPTIGNIDAYTVPPNMPRVLSIKKLGILTPIKHVGTSGPTQIANPQNIYEVGWYEGSAKPGEAGAVALIGNAAGPSKEGVFINLDALAVGDSIAVDRGDGQTLRYSVVAAERVVYGRPVIEKMMSSYDPKKEGLNLITGSGAFNRALPDYQNRLLIYAIRES